MKALATLELEHECGDALVLDKIRHKAEQIASVRKP